MAQRLLLLCKILLRLVSQTSSIFFFSIRNRLHLPSLTHILFITFSYQDLSASTLIWQISLILYFYRQVHGEVVQKGQEPGQPGKRARYLLVSVLSNNSSLTYQQLSDFILIITQICPIVTEDNRQTYQPTGGGEIATIWKCCLVILNLQPPKWEPKKAFGSSDGHFFING